MHVIMPAAVRSPGWAVSDGIFSLSRTRQQASTARQLLLLTALAADQ